MNPRVISVQYYSPYKLVLQFTNKETRLFDFSGYLNYPAYSRLKDEDFSKNVHAFNGTVKWNDEIDFDPDTLYLESAPFFRL